MFMAAAQALAELSPAATTRTARLLPPVTELREVALAVAAAVARQAAGRGRGRALDDETLQRAHPRADLGAGLPALPAQRRFAFRPASLRDDD